MDVKSVRAISRKLLFFLCSVKLEFSGCHVEKKVYHDGNGYRLHSRRVCTYAARCGLNFRFVDRKCHWWIPWHMGSLQALWINGRFSKDDSWSLKDNYPAPALSPAPEESFKGGSRLVPPVSGYWGGIVKWYMLARCSTSCNVDFPILTIHTTLLPEISISNRHRTNLNHKKYGILT